MIPNDFIDLVRGMLAKDPKQRITAGDLLEHPFLNDDESPKSLEKDKVSKNQKTFFSAESIMEKVKVKSTVTVSLKPKV